jgi:hypothetical protein
VRRQNGRDRSAATDPHVRIFMAPRPPPRYSSLPLIQRGQQGRQEPAPRSVALSRAPAPEHGRVPCRGARHHSAAFRRLLPRRKFIGSIVTCARRVRTLRAERVDHCLGERVVPLRSRHLGPEFPPIRPGRALTLNCLISLSRWVRSKPRASAARVLFPPCSRG